MKTLSLANSNDFKVKDAGVHPAPFIEASKSDAHASIMESISFDQVQWAAIVAISGVQKFENLPKVDAAFLKRLRQISGLSQQSFAEKLGVSMTTVRRWEKEAGEIDEVEAIPSGIATLHAPLPTPLTFSGLMKRKGLSVNGLAASMGFTSRTVGKWINGQALPHLSPEETEKLLDLLDCSLKDLVRSFAKINSYNS